MTIQQLKYILAIDRHRQFGPTAEACFVTQPTLSAQVNKLERELDVLIFDCPKMPVIPTEIGVQLIEQAKQAVSESKGIYETIVPAQGEYRRNGQSRNYLHARPLSVTLICREFFSKNILKSNSRWKSW